MNKEQIFYKVLKCPFGWIGVAASIKGISKIQLPEKDKTTTQKKLCRNLINPVKVTKEQKWINQFEKLLEKYFQGKPVDFCNLPIDIKVSDFQKRVYEELRKIAHGQIMTYKELAEKINSANSSRAIGMAMGKNPIPLILPCHRVISSSKNSLGGFTAFGGVDTKHKLLKLEKVNINPVRPPEIEFLLKDKRLSKIILATPSFKRKKQGFTHPYESLIKAVVYQQLHERAASTIYMRFLEKFANQKMVASPLKITKSTVAELCQVGLSQSKAKAITAICQNFLAGKIPDFLQMKKMTDEEIITSLTQIYGVGRWTVQMFLIFDLYRPDIWPTGDFAIKKAYSQIHSLPDMLTEKELEMAGEKWKPFRSFASWYLWRSLEI